MSCTVVMVEKYLQQHFTIPTICPNKSIVQIKALSNELHKTMSWEVSFKHNIERRKRKKKREQYPKYVQVKKYSIAKARGLPSGSSSSH